MTTSSTHGARAAPWLRWVARDGVVAQRMIYLLIGGLALAGAFDAAVHCLLAGMAGWQLPGYSRGDAHGHMHQRLTPFPPPALRHTLHGDGYATMEKVSVAFRCGRLNGHRGAQRVPGSFPVLLA
ncbi:MAG: hypothetical protein WC617_12015 [Rhodanobacter sp.]